MSDGDPINLVALRERCNEDDDVGLTNDELLALVAVVESAKRATSIFDRPLSRSLSRFDFGEHYPTEA